MGIFSRIGDIINSNLNAMLDKAENPEKMVKLMISEMEDTLIEIKSSAAAVVAEKIRQEREIARQKARQEEWESKAQLALNKGREDLARQALEQKLQCQGVIESCEARLKENEGLVKQYQSDIARLEDKLESAKRRQKTLVANHKSLMNRKKVEEKIYKVNTSGAFSRFENYEQRMDQMEAEAEVLSESNQTLDKEFHDLEHENEVDQELEALKKKVSKGT